MDMEENIRLLNIENSLETIILLITNQKQSKTKSKIGSVTKKLREEILMRDNWTCQNCKKSIGQTKLQQPSDFHIDHIIPRSKGGSNEKDNLQVLCKSCNLIKLNHLFSDIPQINLKRRTTKHDG